MVKAKFSPVFPKGQKPNWSNGLGTKVEGTLKEAIGAKGSPATIDEAIKVNPHYSIDYREYSSNCQRCVVAYELQRRGYDVQALATYKGDTLPQVAYYDTNRKTWEGRWKGAFKGAKTINVGVRGNAQKTIENMNGAMRGFGPGSRGVVQVFWKSGGGHVFNVENDRGIIKYVDAQTNRHVNIKNYMAMAVPGSVNLVRTDNLQISERAKNFVTTRRY